MRVKQALWIGCVEPSLKDPLNNDYWTTDMSAKDLGAKYGFHANKAGSHIEPAILTGTSCRVCDGKIVLKNRTEASATIAALSKTSGWSADRWERQACADCQKKEREEERAKHFADLRERFSTQSNTEDALDRYERLRTMPYSEYLKTEDWDRKRKAALKRAGYACQVCYSNQSLHVHHRTYRNRGGELPADLTVLCAECHELFHERMKIAELREQAA